MNCNWATCAYFIPRGERRSRPNERSREGTLLPHAVLPVLPAAVSWGQGLAVRTSTDPHTFWWPVLPRCYQHLQRWCITTS